MGETYARLADLPVEIEEYDYARLEQPVSSDFVRVTTVIHMRGRGAEGIGEDVTYGNAEQDALQAAGPAWNVSGRRTLDELSQLLASFDLFPSGAEQHAYLDYRRWAFESAALDLALRQAGQTLAAAVGRAPQPVRYVASMRLHKPPALAPLDTWLDLYPDLRVKLDPTSDWDADLIGRIGALEKVDIVDLKGAYKGTVVDQPPDPALYDRVARGFPNALIEDPALTPETDAVLEPHRDRVTWDAPIHSVDDVLALPFSPKTLNCKPSRFGSLRRLFDFYDWCEENAVAVYGGGQFELGPGRGQIQYLASLFHADVPNDVAPSGFNAPPAPGLPESPLAPAFDAAGFRFTNP